MRIDRCRTVALETRRRQYVFAVQSRIRYVYARRPIYVSRPGGFGFARSEKNAHAVPLSSAQSLAYASLQTSRFGAAYVPLQQRIYDRDEKKDLRLYGTADGWQSYSFKLRFRGSIVRVEISSEKARFELIEGGDVPIECGENVFALSEKNRAVEIKL